MRELMSNPRVLKKGDVFQGVTPRQKKHLNHVRLNLFRWRAHIAKGHWEPRITPFGVIAGDNRFGEKSPLAPTGGHRPYQSGIEPEALSVRLWKPRDNVLNIIGQGFQLLSPDFAGLRPPRGLYRLTKALSNKRRTGQLGRGGPGVRE
jgi:hypothetical protein